MEYAPPWFENYEPRVFDQLQSKLNRQTIRRDNRLSLGVPLPTISVSNMRSFFPKLKKFKNDMKEREISLSILSEIWQKSECKKQQAEIEKMLQMEGLKYISTPRMNKRGGGAAVVVNFENFSVEKIEISNPDKLEVVWGLLRPKSVDKDQKIKEIIVAAFYSPPKSTKNPLLQDHLVSTSHYLLSKYPNAGIVIGGDKNSLNISLF